MGIPNAEHAVVAADKLTTYLLAFSHPVGASKARFFRSHGFDEQTVDLLAAGLRSIARGPASSVRPGPFGTKYVVAGALQTPRGSTVQIQTVWIVEPHDDRPRLVTAYPSVSPRP